MLMVKAYNLDWYSISLSVNEALSKALHLPKGEMLL